MSDLSEYYQLVSAGGRVKRFHTRDTIRQQNVGEHSFNTALLAYEIAMKLNSPEVNAVNCMRYMLYHDLPEQHTGDMPGNIKGDNRALHDAMQEEEEKWLNSTLRRLTHQRCIPELSDTDKIICKFCDLFDCYMFSLNEEKIGNSDVVGDIVANCRAEIWNIIQKVRNGILFDMLIDLMREVDE